MWMPGENYIPAIANNDNEAVLPLKKGINSVDIPLMVKMLNMNEAAKNSP